MTNNLIREPYPLMNAPEVVVSTHERCANAICKKLCLPAPDAAIIEKILSETFPVVAAPRSISLKSPAASVSEVNCGGTSTGAAKSEDLAALPHCQRCEVPTQLYHGKTKCCGSRDFWRDEDAMLADLTEGLEEHLRETRNGNFDPLTLEQIYALRKILNWKETDAKR